MSRLSQLIRTLAAHAPQRIFSRAGNRKPPLVLHVGPHKTGSTAIQTFCVRNRDHVAKAGLWYPTVGLHHSQHLVLPACYLDHHPSIPPAIFGGCAEEIVASMAAEVPRGLTPLMSSEVFWELLCNGSDAFESVLAMLGRRYQVFIAVVDRPIAERAWSAVKHLSRIGYAFDPVATFHGYQDEQRLAMERLGALGCPVIRVPYDHADCISPFLESLATELPSMQTARSARLDALIQRCRSDASSLRENVAPPDPWFVAFTMEFSRRLLATRGQSTKVEQHVDMFFREVVAIGNDVESTRRLPNEAAVLRRVVEASGPLACLLTPPEVSAWESVCQNPALQLAAMRMGCVDELRLVSRRTGQHRRAA